MKKLVALATALALALGTVTTSLAAENTAEPTLRAVCQVSAENFDPLVATMTDKLVNHALFDCLFKFESDGTVVPMLVDTFEQDGLEVTLHLRQDAVFSSGNPVTAKDVVFSYNQVLKDPTLRYNMTGISTGMDVVDDYTVALHLVNDYDKWQNYFAELLYIVEEASYEEGKEYLTEAPVGSGPYTLVGMDEAKTVTLKANDNYWGGAPEFKTVEVCASVDNATGLVALQTGEVDLLAQVGKDAYNQAAADPNLKAIAFDGWQIMGIMNFVGDEAFRQAVFHGINRETILAICNDGKGSVATNMYSAKTMDRYLDKAPFTGYDPELAAECIAKSETDLSHTFTLSVFDADSAAVAQCVKVDLAALGINVDISQTDANTFFENLMSGNLEMGLLAMGTDMVSVEGMFSMFSPEQGYPFKNITDDLVNKAETVPLIEDKEEHEAAVIDTLNQLAVECPWVPLYDNPMYAVHSNRVGNVNECGAATYVYYFGDMTVEE